MDASHEDDDDDDDGDGDVLRDGRATKLTPLRPLPANRTEINCGLCKWATLFASTATGF